MKKHVKRRKHVKQVWVCVCSHVGVHVGCIHTWVFEYLYVHVCKPVCMCVRHRWCLGYKITELYHQNWHPCKDSIPTSASFSSNSLSVSPDSKFPESLFNFLESNNQQYNVHIHQWSDMYVPHRQMDRWTDRYTGRTDYGTCICNRWKIVAWPDSNPRPFIDHANTLPLSYWATRSYHQQFSTWNHVGSHL